jgi:hypothetical protein
MNHRSKVAAHYRQSRLRNVEDWQCLRISNFSVLYYFWPKPLVLFHSQEIRGSVDTRTCAGDNGKQNVVSRIKSDR